MVEVNENKLSDEFKSPLFGVRSKQVDSEHKIAILDLPGLDSAQSEFTQKTGSDSSRDCPTWYDLALARCDYLLFVQSSLSAINLPSKEILKKIVESNTNPSILLVHNRFERQPWIKNQKALRKKDDELMERKGDELLEKLDMGDVKIPYMSVNLKQAAEGLLIRGKADQYLIKGGYKALLKESGYMDLEKYLTGQLVENRERIIHEKASGMMVKALEGFRGQIQRKEKICRIESDLLEIHETDLLRLFRQDSPLQSPYVADGDWENRIEEGILELLKQPEDKLESISSESRGSKMKKERVLQLFDGYYTKLKESFHNWNLPFQITKDIQNEIYQKMEEGRYLWYEAAKNLDVQVSKNKPPHTEPTDQITEEVWKIIEKELDSIRGEITDSPVSWIGKLFRGGKIQVPDVSNQSPATHRESNFKK